MSFVTVHKLEKLGGLDRLHVTALLASNGFLWVGTSIGAVLIYRIPHLGGVPLVAGKPYLAMESHKEAVRVLVAVKTIATVSSSRVKQFISDEDTRNILDAEGGEQNVNGVSTMRRLSNSNYVAPATATFDPSATLRGSPPPLPAPTFDGLSYEEGHGDTRVSTNAGYDNPDELARVVAPNGEVLREEEAEPQETWRVIVEEKEEEVEEEREEEEVEGEGAMEGSAADLPASKELEAVRESTGDDAKQQGLSQSLDYELVDCYPTDNARTHQPDKDDSEATQPIASRVPAPSSGNAQPVSRVPGPSPDLPQAPSPSDQEPDPDLDKTTLKAQVQAKHFTDPDPCDTTMVRVSSPDSGSSTNEYDMVETCHTIKAGDYEDPRTLQWQGPAAIGSLATFFPVQTSLHRSSKPHEGAVFVLTAGRGIVDLRPGKKTGVLFPLPRTRSVVSTAGDESCMIAYEIEV